MFQTTRVLTFLQVTLWAVTPTPVCCVLGGRRHVAGAFSPLKQSQWSQSPPSCSSSYTVPVAEEAGGSPLPAALVGRNKLSLPVKSEMRKSCLRYPCAMRAKLVLITSSIARKVGDADP